MVAGLSQVARENEPDVACGYTEGASVLISKRFDPDVDETQGSTNGAIPFLSVSGAGEMSQALMNFMPGSDAATIICGINDESETPWTRRAHWESIYREKRLMR